MRRIILFDGICNFCNTSVQFILKRDPKGVYQFTSLQSEVGRKLLEDFHVPNGLDSIIYLEGKNLYVKSTAVLKICKNLKGFWKLFYLFIIVPRPLRDKVYDLVARNRYKWFGKQDACMIPTPEQRTRFLDL